MQKISDQMKNIVCTYPITNTNCICDQQHDIKGKTKIKDMQKETEEWLTKPCKKGCYLCGSCQKEIKEIVKK